MGTVLGLNEFSPNNNSVLDDLQIFDIARSPVDQEGMEKLQFEWKWYAFSGLGCIFLRNGVIDLNNPVCKESHFSITMGFNVAIKSYDLRNNDRMLGSVFEYILQNYYY